MRKKWPNHTTMNLFKGGIRLIWYRVLPKAATREKCNKKEKDCLKSFSLPRINRWEFIRTNHDGFARLIGHIITERRCTRTHASIRTQCPDSLRKQHPQINLLNEVECLSMFHWVSIYWTKTGALKLRACKWKLYVGADIQNQYIYMGVYGL